MYSFQEQGKIAKLGLELRLLTSDVDSESEKWEDQDNELLRHGQTMSSMAYTMYLFARYESYSLHEFHYFFFFIIFFFLIFFIFRFLK